jgi:anti-sigma-K factor RskA
VSALPIRDEMAAFALGALEPGERESLEGELSRSPELAREVDEYRQVAALLAFAAPPVVPPPALRQRILADARAVRPIGSARSSLPNEPRAGVKPWTAVGRIVPWLALAASLAFAFVMRDRLTTERQARRIAEGTNASLRSQVASLDSVVTTLLSPDVESVKLTSTGAPPSARMYWNTKSNEVVLAAFQLQPAPRGRTYQLWGIETGKPPVSLGTFNTSDRGERRVRFSVPVGVKIAVGAVTEEPEGGSPQPTTTPFLVGQLKTTD